MNGAKSLSTVISCVTCPHETNKADNSCFILIYFCYFVKFFLSILRTQKGFDTLAQDLVGAG